MKMKRIIGIIIALSMIISTSAFAFMDEAECDDFFNNPIFEVVSVLKSEPSEPSPEAVLISKKLYSDYNSEIDKYSFSEVCYYSDGSFTVKPLFDIKGYYAYPASKYFTYEADCYIALEDTGIKLGDGYLQNIYAFDTAGEEITKTLIGGVVSVYDRDTYSSTYTIYDLDENGEVAKTPTYENISSEEFDLVMNGWEYNDGLKFGMLNEEEEFSLSGFKDINGKVYFADPIATYFGYFYNLGYLVTSTNNGGVLDYELEDPEKSRIYWSTIENVFTGENYDFYDVDIIDIFDSGYAMADVKDKDRNETTYILKIKKPAVIRVLVNGEKVHFDVLPSITDGRTLVPLRAIFEALGAEVEWDGATQTVTATKEDLEVKLTIGSNEMIVGNETKTLDVPAQIVDGRTLVPARAVAEAFGCGVDWNGADQAVIITTK